MTPRKRPTKPVSVRDEPPPPDKDPNAGRPCMTRLWLFSQPKDGDMGGVVCSKPYGHTGTHGMNTEGFGRDSARQRVSIEWSE